MKDKSYTYYGECHSFTSETIIEGLEPKDGKIEITFDIPLTLDIENMFFGRDDLQ